MTPSDDPNATVPRRPVPAAEQTTDHVPADDTGSRAADESSVDPNRTAARPPSVAPTTGTVARTPSDVARLEAGARTLSAEGVPGYVLLRVLGRGGMGVVYQARHVKLNRLVALKMMLGDRAGRADLARFLAEAEAVAAVKHENVVQVYDYGEVGGRPFMALEFCPGGSLAGLLGTGRESVSSTTSARAAARLMSQVARGVAAAHAVGIVHRDLKPANVLLDESGVPKVADFGLVKRDDGSEMTQTGQVLGTPAYMSPEQARGHNKFVGPPADVWALGVMLYQALTGTRPFTADNPFELMAKIATDDPEPPRARVATVPRDLELICLKCLAKAPNRRYPTAQEFADDLDRYLRHEPISARPAGPLERGFKWARRNKAATAALLTSAVGLAVLVGLLASRSQNTDLSTALDNTKTELGTAAEGREKARAVAKKADDERIAAEVRAQAAKEAEDRGTARAADVRYFAQVRKAAEIRDSDPTQAAKLLADKSVCPPEMREVTWGVLNRMCNREYLILPKQAGSALAVARDSKTLAIGGGGDKPTVRLIDPTTGRERRALTGHTAAVTAVAFAANKDVLASASLDGTVRIWDPETGETRRTLKAGIGLQSVALAPDARWVAAGVTGNPFADKQPAVIKFWDLTGDADPVDLVGHDKVVSALAASPDGETLASASADGTVRLWDVSKKRIRAVVTHEKKVTWVTSVAFAPDGKTLASASADGILYVWGSDGKQERRWSGLAAGVYGLAYSPDGQILASAHEGGSVGANQVRLWNPGTGKLRYSFDAAKERLMSATFTPNGEALAAADQAGTVRLWRLNPSEEDVVVKTGAIEYAIAYNPAGDEIATGGGWQTLAGTLHLWDAATGALRRTLVGHKGKVLAVAYAPTGNVLASGDVNGVVKLWDPKAGTARGAFGGHTQEIRCIAMAHKARLAASGGLDRDVCVWDPDTGVERFRLVGHEKTVMGIAFAPDDATLYTTGDDTTVRVWDLTTGTEKARWQTGANGPIKSLALSGDGKTLFTGETSTVRAWNAATGKLLHGAAAPTARIWCTAAFGRRTLATGGEDGLVKLWEQDGLRELVTLSTGKSQVKGLAFAPDGKALAGVGIDGRLRIWR